VGRQQHATAIKQCFAAGLSVPTAGSHRKAGCSSEEGPGQGGAHAEAWCRAAGCRYGLCCSCCVVIALRNEQFEMYGPAARSGCNEAAWGEGGRGPLAGKQKPH
jgi:hypothetical protein